MWVVRMMQLLDHVPVAVYLSGNEEQEDWDPDIANARVFASRRLAMAAAWGISPVKPWNIVQVGGKRP